MRFIYLLFFFIILLSVSWTKVNAQDMIVYNEIKNLDLIFKYDTYKKESSIPNIFISKIAKNQSKIRSYYKFSVSANTEFILHKNKNNYHLLINVDSINISGNFNYKGFDFRNSVLPTKVSIQYNIIELNSKFKSLRSIPLNIQSFQSIKFDSVFTDSSKTGSFSITDEKLIYSYRNKQKDDFEEAISNIEKYYDDGKKLVNINKELDDLEINNIDKIQLQSIDMKYIRKRYLKVNMNDYVKSLSLNITDPAKYYSLFKSTGFRVDSLYLQYQIKVKQLDSLLFEKAMHYSDSNRTEAIKYLNKSLQVNPNNVASIYQLALIDFKNGKLIEAENKINKALSITKTEIQINELANKTYVGMLEKAMKMNDEENYNESLLLLQEAKEFCDNNSKIIVCDSLQDQSIKAAYYGMYYSYVSIAGASIQSNRLKMTENYLNTAYNYQKNNPEAIVNTKEVDALYSLLITEYLRNSLEAKNSYEKKKAEKLFAKADSINSVHNIADVQVFITEVRRKLDDSRVERLIAKEEPKYKTALIENKVSENKKAESTNPRADAIANYKKHFNNGVAYLNYNRYSLAYPEFRLAKGLCNQFDITPDDSLESYLKQSAKPLIIKNIKEGELATWGGRFSAAEVILKNVNNEIAKNNLENDTDIKDALKNLEAKIKDKHDATISKEFNSNMQKAKSSISFNDYSSALVFCNNAKILAEKNPQISFNIDYPNGLIKKYSKAAEYQNLHKEVNTKCRNNEFSKSISTFYKADSLFVSNNLSVFKLKRESLVSYINNCKSVNMTEVGIEFALKRDSVEIAYQIWLNSINNEQIISDNISIKLIQIIAHKDYSNNSQLSKKESYNNRFGSKKPFLKFRKYYYKSYNNN